ncbi:MAG: S41 family peptidase [Bacteroidota bacterium]
MNRLCLFAPILWTLCFSQQMLGQGDLNKQELQHLVAFTKLYGYVRYFHPSDEAAKINWDEFAIYGVTQVLAAKTPGELKKRLVELFSPIAPTVIVFQSGERVAFPPQGMVPKDTAGLKVVAWQHLGVGLNDQGIYSSARTNRLRTVPTPGAMAFGAITQSLNAAPHKGREFRFGAAVKANVQGAGNQGQLWFRVDREGNAMGFFDNMGDRPITHNGWKRYAISGRIDNDARQIVFGCFLLGAGRVWVDDFRLEVKEDGKWVDVPIPNSSFEAGETGKPPSNWFQQAPNYSFQVVAETASDRSKSVLIARHPPEQISTPLFKESSPFGSYVQKGLGSDLSCLVPLALYSDEQGTIPRADPKRLQRLITDISASLPKELTARNRAVRLGNVAIAWNVFQHFYPYFDVVKTDWQRVLPEVLQLAAVDRTPNDFLRTLQKLVAQLHDGHGGVGLVNDTTHSYTAPIEWSWIQNQLVVTKIVDPTLIGLRVGDIVEQVDGRSPRTALEREEQFISGATPQWKRVRSLSALLSGARGTKIALKIKDADNKERSIQIPRTMDIMAYYQKKKATPLGQAKEFAKGIYYLNLDQISIAAIDSLMARLVTAKGIVCDLRGYPNGNHMFIAHLLGHRDTSSSWMRIPRIIYPDRENLVGYQNSGWFLQPQQPRLTAKIAFVVDGRLISYAESFMSFIEHYKLAEIVGEPTAGTNGNVNSLSLPGGYWISWTGMRVVKHDGSVHHGVGIKPTVPAGRTIAGVRAGRDELLEKAIEIVSR